MANKYIHYGSNHFDRECFMPIENREIPWIKPLWWTGMWASPIDASYGWKDWCLDNEFHIEKLKSSFMFELKPDSKILYVRDNQELQNLKTHYSIPIDENNFWAKDLCVIDFEYLYRLGYDAMEVHITTSDIYFGLYGWDCDSILIFNPDCIVTI